MALRWLFLRHGVACDLDTVLEDAERIGVVLNVEGAPARCVRHAVVIAVDRDHAIMADPSFNGQNSFVREGRMRLEAGLLFGEGLFDHAIGGRMDARICNRAAPGVEQGVQILDGAEGSGQKEVLPDVPEGTLHLTCRPSGSNQWRRDGQLSAR
ncbi:MAG: hypothetical protein AAGA15_16030 [Pseudomonadota bacterium]